MADPSDNLQLVHLLSIPFVLNGLWNPWHSMNICKKIVTFSLLRWRPRFKKFDNQSPSLWNSIMRHPDSHTKHLWHCILHFSHKIPLIHAKAFGSGPFTVLSSLSSLNGKEHLIIVVGGAPDKRAAILKLDPNEPQKLNKETVMDVVHVNCTCPATHVPLLQGHNFC